MLKTALSQYGVKEIEGKDNNKTIVGYAKESGFDWVNDDETAWCSIFVNWVTKKTGYERTKKANARSWLEIGEVVEIPEVGDIVVLKRGSNNWQGHVGWFISYDGKWIYVLAGNQGNQVNISRFDSSDVLGFRRLRKLN